MKAFRFNCCKYISCGIIAAATLLMVFVPFNKVSAFAETKVESADAFSRGVYAEPVSENGSKYVWGDSGISLKWFTYQPLLWNTDDDYILANKRDRQPEITGGGIHVVSLPINEEKVGLFGLDSTGITNRLIPVDELSGGTNVCANGAVTLTFSDVSQLPDGCAYSYDSQKMKYISTGLRIPGDDTRVRYGKILYRTAPWSGGTWTSWQYVNFNLASGDYPTLNFAAGKQVHIAVIYEVKQEMSSHTNYYNVRGMYKFNTYYA